MATITGKGIIIECACGRKGCGLGKRPPVPDETDAVHMWIPARYLSLVAGSYVYQKGAPEKQKPEFKTRLEAAKAFVEDYAGG